MRHRLILATVVLAAACAPTTPPGDPAPAPPRPDLAPWIGSSLREGDVPAVYLGQWGAAPNRATCALLAPRAVPPASGVDAARATPRAATFAGGWAVAYDLPETRSAFGVAGTGSAANAPGTYDQWPHERRWADGSRAAYGPEGGTGPNQLAYLTIPGQGCLYNVWSRLGRAHLEALLASLRFVQPR
ncbi:MAG TPA: hypothetical protein VEA99_18465 [Gemmatimonadaceae bacterium]|nr:hypothetical protein [Gemmatimonadaceae bacterium]